MPIRFFGKYHAYFIHRFARPIFTRHETTAPLPPVSLTQHNPPTIPQRGDSTESPPLPSPAIPAILARHNAFAPNFAPFYAYSLPSPAIPAILARHNAFAPNFAP